MTWYPQAFAEKVPMTDMGMRADPSRGYPGRSYRFYKGPVVFPFGYGLSYTSFAHSIAHAPAAVSVPLDGRRAATYANASADSLLGKAVRVTHTRCDSLTVGVHIDVQNTGSRDGTHTLLMFASPPAGHSAPERQLVAFEKVHVPAQSQARVTLDVDVCRDLSFADADGIRRIPIGDHTLHVGDLIKHTFSLQALATRL